VAPLIVPLLPLLPLPLKSFRVLGCTDPYAGNYNAGANTDNGSCSYPDNGDYSLSFDGENDGVSGTASSSLDVSGNNHLTVSAWVKPAAYHGVVFAHTNHPSFHQYALVVNPEGRLYFLSGLGDFEDGGGNVSNSSIPIDEWSHITLTYDGDAIRYYINGVNDFNHYDEDNFTTDYMGEFYIGHVQGGTRYNGLMDEISVWNIALNEEQIQANMSSELNGDEAGLVGHWSFNTGEGDFLYDRSGNSNHGTIGGAGWSDHREYHPRRC
jgi:hypothetical protein